MIEITNKYIDILMSNEVVKTLVKKEFTCKTSYWLARFFDEIEKLSKIFIEEKQKIINKYAQKDEKDEVIVNNEKITILDTEAFQKNLIDLLEIKIEFNGEKIKFDIEEEPKCTIEEMSLLLPLIEVENAGN